MHKASMIVDFHFVRCGGCKVMLDDELATQCHICDALFDRITSNHVGLTAKLVKRRTKAGIELVFTNGPSGAATTTEPDNGSPANNGVPMAAISIDFRKLRCGNCKVMFEDELAERCPICSAVFDRITSNHVGLTAKLETLRAAAK